jgi:L-rhamnose isomerase / sugar isomerase
MRKIGFTIEQGFINDANARLLPALQRDYDALAEQLGRRGIAIDSITEQVRKFAVALPSWGVGTGGTRFGRFPGGGEPRDVFEKFADCAVIQRLMRVTPTVAMHIPWDRTNDLKALAEFACALGLGFDAMNSNTFQDQPGQSYSYKFGSLSHVDPAVRQEAVRLNIECIETGNALGSKALSVWIGDGGNFPGQLDFRKSLERYMESMREIYAALPKDWKVYVEYKLFEPAMYSTVINDWGTAYHVVTELGPKALCLVDLGHHAPNTNIEMIVARLLQFGKLAGFHFNDSKYGDDDLDAGSLRPFQLFLVFHELIGAALDPGCPNPPPAYMIDQSHNVTDPIESLMASAEEIVRAYAQALLVDRVQLARCQEANDAVMALRTLKSAFTTDVAPLLQMARYKENGAIDPLLIYRASGYRQKMVAERPAQTAVAAGPI